MRLTKLFFSLIVTLMLVRTGYSQETAVKIAPFTLLSLDPKISVERLLTEKMSVNAEFIYQGVGFGRGIWNQEFTVTDGNGNTSLYSLPGGRVNRFVISPDLRFYTGSKQMHGFYFTVGPRFSFTNGSADVSYTEAGQPTDEAEGSVKLNMIGGNAGMGVQWIIGDHFLIDWNFLGIGAMTGNLNVSAFSTSFTEEDFLQFESDLQSVQESGLFRNVEFTTEGQTGTVAGRVLLPVWRSTLSIGYAF